jgi:bla regulator protein BlaR1
LEYHFFLFLFRKTSAAYCNALVYGFAGYGPPHAGGLAYVQRLKHYQTQPLGARWQQKVDDLREKLELRKPVKLLESLQVKVPMAIGYLKPVILVPVGAISGLSEKQVEAILAHELAHIYRHDYVFNLLQTLVETIFFYHPGMWWISATVRAERENCCDDIAINLCGDSLTFAGALAELEEMNYAAGPAMAMAFSGRKGSLLGRIKRLVNQPKRSASFTEGFLAACIVMVSLSMVSLSAMAKFGPEFEEFPSFINSVSKVKKEVVQPKPAAAPVVIEKTQSAKAGKDATAPVALFSSEDYVLSVSVAPDSSGKDIIIVKDKKGKIKELYVDGKKVRNKDMPEFQRMIDERTATAGKRKNKKKEYASREDLAEARAALRQADRSRTRDSRVRESRIYVYNYPGTASRARYRSNYDLSDGYVPAPPAPPVSPSPADWATAPAPLAPMRPMKPLRPRKPMRPMKPMQPIPPRPDDPERETKAYEKEMKDYEKELKEWETEMQAYENQNSEEWKEFEKEMEEFGREMASYGKEMGEYARAKTLVYGGSGKAEIVNEEEIEREVERAMERKRDHLERADRERARAAEARAEAAKERAKAAEDRAKATVVRNERMEKLKAELRKDKLIGENDKNFIYKISKDGLYVNEKKQPAEMFEKYKKLFHPGMSNSSTYNEVYVISDDGESRTNTVTNNESGGKAKAKAKTDKNKTKTKPVIKK